MPLPQPSVSFLLIKIIFHGMGQNLDHGYSARSLAVLLISRSEEPRCGIHALVVLSSPLDAILHDYLCASLDHFKVIQSVSKAITGPRFHENSSVDFDILKTLLLAGGDSLHSRPESPVKLDVE